MNHFLGLLLSLSFLSAYPIVQKGGELYVIDNGFVFRPEEYTGVEVYEGGAWTMYFQIEQELSVKPALRRFLTGSQMLLFHVVMNEEGKPELIDAVERYYWYTIDHLARSFVDDFMLVIKALPGWKAKGIHELWIPVKFRTGGGRISIDYNAFVTGGVGKIRIGKK